MRRDEGGGGGVGTGNALVWSGDDFETWSAEELLDFGAANGSMPGPGAGVHSRDDWRLSIFWARSIPLSLRAEDSSPTTVIPSPNTQNDSISRETCVGRDRLGPLARRVPTKLSASESLATRRSMTARPNVQVSVSFIR